MAARMASAAAAAASAVAAVQQAWEAEHGASEPADEELVIARPVVATVAAAVAVAVAGAEMPALAPGRNIGKDGQTGLPGQEPSDGIVDGVPARKAFVGGRRVCAWAQAAAGLEVSACRRSLLPCVKYHGEA